MKNFRVIFIFLALISFCFTTCNNPIMESWWDDGLKETNDLQPSGSGDNFGVVFFDTDGGTPQPKVLKIAWGSVVGRLRPVSRGNDGFLGWFDEKGELWDVEKREVKKEDDADEDGYITLTAKWSASAYTVKFVPYPGSTVPVLPGNAVTIQDQYIAPGARLVMPVNPPVLDDGRGFAGWYTSEDYASRWDFELPVSSHVTLYAKWESNTRTVIFVVNGGTRPDTSIMTRLHFTVPVGSLVQDPGPLVKDGFAFGGWYPNSACLTDSTCTASCRWDFRNDEVPDSSEPLYLYAKWVQNVYYVDFVVSPSTAAAPARQSVPHGGRVTQPINPRSLTDGRIFAGWYTVDGNTNINGWHQQYIWSFLYGAVTETMTLYARWVDPTIGTDPAPKPGESEGSGENFGVVVFDTNGGTPQPRALKIEWGSVVGRLRPVSRGNDGFLGWFDEKGDLWDVETREVTKEDDVDGDGFITLTIEWVDIDAPTPVYTVEFVPYPAPIIPPVEPEVIASQFPVQYVALHTNVVQPVKPVPYNATHGFAGWYTEGGSLWDFSIGVQNDVILYAKWEENTRTVRFDADGGTRPDGVTVFTHEYTIALNYGLIQDPGPLVKTGYSFGGWFIAPDFSGQPWNFAKKITDSDVPQVNPLILYARWVRNQYIVKFDISPSAEPAPNQQTIAHGDTITQPANPPQLGDGRGFTGWYTENTFTNQWDFTRPVTGNMTLFAQFTPQTRTVIFHVNGGNDFSRTNFTIFVGNRILNPGNPIRAGHIFDGWFFDPECTGSTIDFTSYTVQSPDTIIGLDALYLYAGWTLAPHTVRFYIGGTEVDSQSIRHGEQVQIPDITNPVNKTLDGWYLSSGFSGSLWDFNTAVTSNISLYARWLDAGYVVRYYLGTGAGDSAGKIPQWDAPPGKPYLEQYYRAGDRINEPSMPALPEGDTTSWSFLRWDVRIIPNSTDVTNINDPGWRNALQPLNNWSVSFPNYLTESGGIRVINLYARWVPPVPDMVWVPRGSFIMGDSSVSGSSAPYHAYPTRRVNVDGFYISKYEVTEVNSPNGTIRSYATVTGANPSQFSKNTNRPVERVSWYDAINYCNLLTEQTSGLGAADRVYTMSGVQTAQTPLSGSSGVRPIISATVTQTLTGRNGYRLPTEAEWEYAARGGNGSPDNFTYAGSNTPDPVAWYNLTVQAEMSGNQATQPAGSKQPNALGIYDMSGNVSEWVWDWFASYKDSYYTTSAGNNPIGPSSGTERVRRGGGWSNAAGNVRSVVRNSDTPDSANWVVGFRVVRGPSQIW